MYLVRVEDIKSLSNLIGPFLLEIKQLILIEGGANRLVRNPSQKVKDLVREIDSWIIKKDNYQHEEFTNIIYFLNFDETLLRVLEKFSDDISKWVYPNLLEDMNFLRSNGHSLMYVNFLGNANFYLKKSELEILRKTIPIDNKNIILFSDFMFNPENESDDSDSWTIISNYPKSD